ncbi:MAG: hypothetical protein B7733_24980 [Myxococcales bacterium FL481]|nr:MAG: hypothetical protein B7733_24980 [Myxococcales bacterium FL481]
MATVLLEPVAAGQVRFRLPGLAADARGIAVGREALLVFDTLDALVAFLAAYSDEASLDTLFAAMSIDRARREGGGTALLLRAAGNDGYALDRLVRLAHVARGRVYTGSNSLFVGFRDRTAPFGYDLASSASELATSDPQEVVVVERDHATHYRPEEWVNPVDLLLRLAVRPQPLPSRGVGDGAEECGVREMALVLVSPGLGDRVVAYLWRHKVSLAGTRVALGDDRRAAMLLRLRNPAARVLEVLFRIPGVELLAPISTRAAVEIGWQHPINLAAAANCLPGEEMYLFRGRVGRVERLDSAPRFVDARVLVQSRTSELLRDVGDSELRSLEPLEVELTLRSTVARREPRGVLVPWEQVELLRRVLYLMPPSALAASRVTALREGVLVLIASGSQRGLAIGDRIIPLGRRLCEMAPGVLVCDGYELYPRVSPELLRELLGIEGDDRALFLGPGRAPLRLHASKLVALEAAALGRVALEPAEVPEHPLAATTPARVANDKLGRFALWGFRAGGD